MTALDTSGLGVPVDTDPLNARQRAFARAQRDVAAKYGTRASADHAVDLACRTLLRDAGVKVGATARVLTGRHAGLVGTIETVSWSEAEVRLHGCARWFSLWRARPEFEVQR